MIRYIFLVTFFIASLVASSNITINEASIYNNFEVLYYEDKTNKLQIENIKEINFTKKTKNSFALGRSKSSFWFKVKITNNSEKENFILTVNESFYEIFELYEDKKHFTGLRQKIIDRDIKSNKLALNLNIPNNQSKTLYIKLKAHFSYFGKFILYEKESFYLNNYLGINSFFIFLFGVLFIIFTFNFFLFIKLKESIYFYYSGYIFFLFIYLLNMSGLLAYLDLSHYLYKIQFTGTYATGFFILFSLLFLETKKHLPKIDRIMKFFAGLTFIFGSFYIFSFKPWAAVTSTTNSTLLIVLVFISIIIAFKDKTKSIYYIIAMGLYIVAFYFFKSMVDGDIEYNKYTRYCFFFMVFLEVSIFALVLSNRYNELKDETIKTQEDLIKVKSEKELVLEDKIEKRTKKISNLLIEKELLLRELHHRVKNNFHMLLGLLHLEKTKKDESESYTDLINRVSSMSLIHEYLYNNENLTDINIKTYLEDIINNIKNNFHKTKVNSDVQELILGFDEALSLGIIVNEILTNSVKHNKLKSDLYIKVELLKIKNTLSLSITDNGSGFSNKNKGLGLKLVDQFSKKLTNSKYNFSVDKGCKFVLDFEINNTKANDE